MIPTILLVDDSIVARLSIKSILRETGAAFAEATTGEDALEQIEGGLGPALVFLDLTMPGIGGLETLRILRKEHPEIKVAVVTADIQARTLDEARSLGAFEVVRKPADKATILALWARASGRGGES
jgi:CheY-like chemotaxis protein